MLKKIFTGVFAVVLALVVGLAVWLSVAPPALLRVGTGYAAKIICSNVFLAGRDAKAVLAEDVQAPGHPLLKLVSFNFDGPVVTVRLLGVFAPGIAVHRPGLGCVSVPGGDIAKVTGLTLPEIKPEPQGAAVVATGALADLLAAPALTGPGLRAIVVMQDGKIIGEAYGDGFSPDSRLLGWSMTKTVNAALVGRAALEKGLSLDQVVTPEVTIRDLAAMKSGLAFNEDYGGVSDVSRMLYLEADMASFALSLPKGEKTYAYSTGSSVILTRSWMKAVGTNTLTYPHDALFGPLGMTSAVFETDESGTFVGGSYLYATARDWGRFGQFLLQDGVWQGKRLLPEGFVAMMRTSNGSEEGYSQMQSWLKGPGESDTGKMAGLPADTFWLRGHDGQSVTIIPSQRLIVVRMGLTPWDLGYRPEALVKAVSDAM
ncbi:beta-lactamase family protein [Asticcacaulis biprosthecium C19]|uniref:Beta-lactamase family protein n=1 Tax=Asticcacaulis biprosthecium C19 TaxID=715226 RepID=F4QT02_9CAUL|nr:serine hydrolase [Asticcacaulis biprosthecium]EGF89872.1 beta-lactamase family protein [Asticcacaulis biprosthecium C19]